MVWATMEQSQSSGNGSKADASHSVLLVDDEQAFSTIMGIILKLSGFTVQRVSSATQALELLSQSTPDLILADVMMPEIDGLTLVRRLRSEPAWSEIPTVVVTAKSGPETVAAAKQAGANAFLAKPFSAEELRDAIRPLLR